MNITRKDVICYAVLPQILPRLRALFATGFQYIPYFVALVYSCVRLLPADHPYLDSRNIGQYGLRHVVAAAAQKLVFSWRHIDQIILFFMVLVGIVMVFMQVLLLLVAIIAGPVIAAAPPVATNFAGLFSRADTQHDIAFMTLDMVFGVEGIFNSCVADAAVPCTDAKGEAIRTAQTDVSWGLDPTAGGSVFPTPMHVGLHQMFQAYSLGLLVVAAFIFIYFIVTILAETMQSGTPFGKRYNHVWAPIRMVVAFGLLMPISSGLNTSQYIVLYAAKYGSNFASNGWTLFNEQLNFAHGAGMQSILPDSDASGTGLIATPAIPDVTGVKQFMSMAKVCAIAYDRLSDSAEPVSMWAVKDPTAAIASVKVDANGGTFDYEKLLEFAAGADLVKFRFGYQKKETIAGTFSGSVAPLCGEIVLRLTDSVYHPGGAGDPKTGSQLMQEVYYAMLKDMWHNVDDTFALDYVIRNGVMRKEGEDKPAETSPALVSSSLSLYNYTIAAALNSETGATVYGAVTIPAGGALKLMQDAGRWQISDDLMKKGWAGSAIWYNRIAEMNGAMSTALLNIPTPLLYPMLSELVYAEKRQGDGEVDFSKRFEPVGAAAKKLKAADDLAIAQVSWEVYDFWQTNGAAQSVHARPSSNAVTDILNALLGTNGLFDMRANENVHPLAQLSGVGKALIEASIRNLTNVAVGGTANAFLNKISQFTGQSLTAAISFLLKFTMITITAGFILFYIVPFLPFIYFTFAFGGWIKGIFEAMVGAPLWALAHIRIDGQGLAGQAAVSGYFLIFEIFLRPILMIFGLIASISTFAALVSVLNLVFDQVVSNVGGGDAQSAVVDGSPSALAGIRSVVDEFFFTVMYVIVVYLMGMSSFKLIDNIPNQILRWMGQSVTTFNDSRENAAEGLAGKATQGAQQTSGALGGGLSKLATLGRG